MNTTTKKINVIDRIRLPQSFPTHHHSKEFWEQLGRTVACFGFLEEILKKAILAFSTTKNISESDIEKELETWNNRMDYTISAQLYSLTELFERVVKENSECNDELKKINELVCAIRNAADLRNAICHASWNQPPDNDGYTTPFFVNKRHEIFDTPVNIEFFAQTQKHVTHLIYDVMDAVTVRGWQFPGSYGPGQSIWKKN